MSDTTTSPVATPAPTPPTALAMDTPSLDKPWLLPPQTTYKLINASVVDPVQGRLLDHATVVLAGGRILSVTTGETDTEAAATREPEETVVVVDLRGLYLCPGLIDAHVHVTATPGEQGLKNTYKNIAPSMNNYRTVYVVREMLARGFTTVRDCGGADHALKQAIDEWLVTGPRLVIAGHALSQTGGHGDQRDAHVDDHHQCCGGSTPGISRLCDGPAACIAAVRDEMRKGADFVKIMAGGGVSSRLHNLEHSQFLPDEIAAIAATAASFDTYVTAHAYSNRAMRHAVAHGARGIEHGSFLDDATAAYLAHNGVFFTPTLATCFALVRSPYDRWISADSRAKNDRVMRAGLASLAVAERAGLPICFGTDLMASMQPLQTSEFAIRARVQSSVRVLQSATVHPARMMRMEDRVGRVAAGLWADVLVLARNPLEDVAVLDACDTLLAVIKDGRVVTSRLAQLPVESYFVNKR